MDPLNISKSDQISTLADLTMGEMEKLSDDAVDGRDANQTIEERGGKEGKESYIKKSKRILCFAAFVTTLTFFSTALNSLFTFILDIVENENVMSAVEKIIVEKDE